MIDRTADYPISEEAWTVWRAVLAKHDDHFHDLLMAEQDLAATMEVWPE